MLDKRPFESLGFANHGWLKARHHFSFANYFDPDRMGWGPLRVWNDDEIAAGAGFPPHPHKDMEIITYVRQGAITHEDSIGNKGRTKAGDVQVMSAGSGVRHSEWNAEGETTTLFQIWIHPARAGGAPRWDAAEFPKEARDGAFTTLASGDPDRFGGLLIRTDARLLAANVAGGAEAKADLRPGASGYLALAKGSAEVNGLALGPRDGLAVKGEEVLALKAGPEGAEIVLVETAA